MSKIDGIETVRKSWLMTAISCLLAFVSVSLAAALVGSFCAAITAGASVAGIYHLLWVIVSGAALAIIVHVLRKL